MGLDLWTKQPEMCGILFLSLKAKEKNILSFSFIHCAPKSWNNMHPGIQGTLRGCSISMNPQACFYNIPTKVSGWPVLEYHQRQGAHCIHKVVHSFLDY